MSDVKVEHEVTLSREEVADWLADLADAIREGGTAELSLSGPVLTLPVADEMDLEIEVEIDGDEVELEIELSWRRSSRSAPQDEGRGRRGGRGHRGRARGLRVGVHPRRERLGDGVAGRPGGCAPPTPSRRPRSATRPRTRHIGHERRRVHDPVDDQGRDEGTREGRGEGPGEGAGQGVREDPGEGPRRGRRLNRPVTHDGAVTRRGRVTAPSRADPLRA